MQREIKFRSFIDGEMVFLPLAGLQYFDFEGNYALSFVVDGYTGFWGHEQYERATKEHCSNAPIMQFTGLKDKNGKEIYEGDIVKCHDHPTGVEDTIGAVEAKHGHYQVNGHPLHDYGTAWTEVIGNQFENPELIAF